MMGGIEKNIHQQEEDYNKVQVVVRVSATCALDPGMVQANRRMDIKKGSAEGS